MLLFVVFLALQPIVVVFAQPGTGRYNPLWLYFHSPVAGFRGFLITHNDAPQSVGLPWTSDQSVEETST